MRDVYATKSVASRIGRAHRNTTIPLSRPAPPCTAKPPHAAAPVCTAGPVRFQSSSWLPAPQGARPNTCSYVALFSGGSRGTHFGGSPTGGCLRGV
eukprot:4279790-Pyramimonas_sp.AAC.1